MQNKQNVSVCRGEGRALIPRLFSLLHTEPSKIKRVTLIKIQVLYLENINLILAFIINLISQPIEHLNISSAFIVKLIRKCTWYFLTQWSLHTALTFSCLGGSVGMIREYCTLLF